MNADNAENVNQNVNQVFTNLSSSKASRPMTTPGKLNEKTPKKGNINVKCRTPSRPMSATSFQPPSTPSSTRDAAIQAKLLSTAERIRKVATLKDKWAKEKARKVQSHRERRANELKKQQEIMLAACEERKRILEKNRQVEEKKKKQEKELLTSSIEASAQLSKDLAEKLKDRRRQSIALNNEIFYRAKQKAEELAAQKKAEQDR